MAGYDTFIIDRINNEYYFRMVDGFIIWFLSPAFSMSPSTYRFHLLSFKCSPSQYLYHKLFSAFSAFSTSNSCPSQLQTPAHSLYLPATENIKYKC